MISDSVWIIGTSRSGKTTYLTQKFCDLVETTINHSQEKGKETHSPINNSHLLQPEPRVLILASNDDNRRLLSDQIVNLTGGKYPFRAKTTLGFIQDEVILFWPLLVESLQIQAQFPVRLRPETEQELATKLWDTQLDAETLQIAGVNNQYRLVRKLLDILQLAAYSGVSCTEISKILQTGLQGEVNNLDPEFVQSLLLNWRRWCLERGFLTYGLITELYHQHLLKNSQYQQKLKQRYQMIIADDVDDYPAITYHLFEFLLDAGAVGAFSYNPHGWVRWGLGADPKYLEKLKNRCQVVSLNSRKVENLADKLGKPMVKLVTEKRMIFSLPKSVNRIQTNSRAQLLRNITEVIIDEIKSGKVEPEEIAIIAPGLDAIARYTFIEILTKQNILVESLNEQLPLISSPAVRALLTLLTLVYPGLGRLVDRDEVAEMLVVLSQNNSNTGEKIDPVRAGLIADNCFVPHPEHPHLQDVKTFERWDRIGYTATTTYNQILTWIENKKSKIQTDVSLTPIKILYDAIQDFFYKNNHLQFQTLSALRELLETAQHYWEIDTRLKQKNPTSATQTSIIFEFIQLLKRGTITANPYPIRPIGNAKKAITLATVFQYRASHKHHKWHFWLDAGSPLWSKGGAATLFGATLFLQDRLGEPWTVEDEQKAETERLQRIIVDLLSRVSEKVYLCHSELAVNGQEQTGPLLPLVNACDE
ncbi:recombinase family protein [Okeanomitos corallinicola TIOX110]|uniref:Recombinase family protein n=1 Tax=Okeanomitos corallinicola TIOX110 TaxID=3133117 RepID=A0ABZ2UWE4_9CYAN